MPTFAALVILLMLLIGAQIVLRQLHHAAEPVVAAAGQRLPADPRGRHDVRHPHRRHRPVGRVGHGVHRHPRARSCWPTGCPRSSSCPLMILGGAAIGLLIGVLVQYFDVQPFIASLAGLFLARGLAFVVSLSSIKVEDPAILWLQSTRFQLGGLVHHPDRHHRPARRARSACSCCSGPASAARSTRSAATSSPHG